MKHPSSREFFAYWDKKRGAARAPDRADIDPAAVRGLLGDIFVLSCEPNLGFPFRVAGTRVCALAGPRPQGQSFAALFIEASRSEIEEITTIVADETSARSPASPPRARTAARRISSCCCCPSMPARIRR